MKDFAKSVRTNNADLGLRPVVPQLVKDIAKIYEDNGKDREKTKQELIQKHHMSERQAEDVLRQIVGNSLPGAWRKTSSIDGPAQQKDYTKYSLIVQEDEDKERGKKWWSWYVYRGSSEIAGGESNSESEAKAKAESWLEHNIPMPTGNKKVGNEYKPDVTKTPAEYERLIKQAKKKEELSDILDDVDYDIKEYEVAIDYCNEQIKQHQRMMSTLRMVQRDAKDALNKI